MEHSLKRVGVIVGLYLLIAVSVYFTSGNDKTYQLDETEQLGLKMWQNHKCMTCHSIYGVGGHIGPDLTNSFSEFGSQYLLQTIRYGRGKMPSFKLSDGEATALVQYLEKVDNTGRFPVENFPEDYFGNFD